MRNEGLRGWVGSWDVGWMVVKDWLVDCSIGVAGLMDRLQVTQGW